MVANGCWQLAMETQSESRTDYCHSSTMTMIVSIILIVTWLTSIRRGYNLEEVLLLTVCKMNNQIIFTEKQLCIENFHGQQVILQPLQICTNETIVL